MKQDILSAIGSCHVLQDLTGTDLRPELYGLIKESTGKDSLELEALTDIPASEWDKAVPEEDLFSEFAWLDEQFQTGMNKDLLERISGKAKGNKEKKETVPQLSYRAEKLLAELDAMTGLDSVKTQVHALAALMQVANLRKQKGLKAPDVTKHMVFSGAPGTGKTTVARLLAQIMKELGALTKGHLVETSRQDLVAGHVGQTAIKTNEVLDKAKGGLLFIDEAYALYKPDSANDFGKEAIETLLKRMEDDREDLCVVAAGYPEPMEQFLDANPGLRSRFPLTISFPDYTADELLQITEELAKKQDYELADEAKALLRQKYELPHEKGFANGRTARTVLEKAIQNQAVRILKENSLDNLTELTAQDFQ